MLTSTKKKSPPRTGGDVNPIRKNLVEKKRNIRNRPIRSSAAVREKSDRRHKAKSIRPEERVILHAIFPLFEGNPLQPSIGATTTMSSSAKKTHRLYQGRLQLPWTQDLKEIFFNDGVLLSLEYAFHNNLFPIEKMPLEYAQIQRAYWVVEEHRHCFIGSSTFPLLRSLLFYEDEIRVMGTFAKPRYSLKVAILYVMNIFLGSALIWALCVR